MVEKILECYSLPVEMNFMFSLAMREESPTIPEHIDWKKFDAFVSKNRIEPLVAEGIKKLPSDVIKGNQVLEKLLSEQNKYILFSMRQMQILTLVIKNLSEAGIRALSLKGPILAMELYGNPALRYSRDLDILVAEKDIKKACECLEQLGYEEEITVRNKTPLRRHKLEKKGEEMHRVYHKGDICIEIHWRLSFRIEETFEHLWINSRTKILLGQEIHYLGEYDNVSYLICHAAGHGYQRLRWLLDIYELQRKPSFSSVKVYKFMKKQKIGFFLIETLLVLYRISCFDMKFRQNYYFCIGRTSHKVIVQYEDINRNDFVKGCELTEAVYPLLVKDTIEGEGFYRRKYNYLLPVYRKNKNIIQFIIEILEPCKADLELIDLPDSLYFLYYVIRPFYKIWRMMPFTVKRNK